MAKGRSPSEQSTRTVRITIGDYALLAQITERDGVSFAEAFHLRAQPTIAVNGTEHGALSIKPKGGIVHE